MFFLFIFFVCDFLRSSGEHIFGSIATVFASNEVFRWGLISYGRLNFKVKNFPLLNPQKHEFLDPFLTGLRKFSAKNAS